MTASQFVPPVYVPVAEARKLPGLRLVLSAGVPGPWGVAAKAMFDVKGIAYTPVAQKVADPNSELLEWTGHNNAPIAMYDNERTRTGWSEILFLAERLKPEPALIPASPEQRALMLGLCQEICGEQGLGWSARLVLFGLQEQAGETGYTGLKARYSSGESLDQSLARVNALVGLFERQMERQASAGSDYLIGDSLTALDIYWMAFSNLLDPMAPELCEMPDFYRQIGPFVAPHLAAPVPAILLAHRDHIAKRHLALPLGC
jgi:glutathione S-transferase